MNEPDDKVFHDWVRQSLDAYRPPYDPQDWAQLQRTLRRKRWWRRGMLGSVGVLLVGLLSWYLVPTLTISRPKPYASESATKKLVHTQTSTATTEPVHQSAASAFPIFRKSVTRSMTPFLSAASTDSHSRTPAAFLITTGTIRLPESSLTEQIHLTDPVAFSPEETAITKQITTGNFGPDSTTYRVVARNLRQWPDAVLVCDLTTSMYPYATQLAVLLKRYAANPSVQGMVFFTDCDSLGQQTYAGGLPGRMFISRSRDGATILPILLRAARNTVRNEDNDENDIEALLVAQREFPQAKHLILVADNMSQVKDMTLLGSISKPVHVILCGATNSSTGLAYQPDYATIASQTNGSLHTLEDDISPKTLTASTTLRINSQYYRYIPRKKQFRFTHFRHRPRRLLGFMWW